MTDQAIAHLAVVGHTNTGKTSLLRTLARDERFGEVADRPATTRSVTAVDLLDAEGPALRLFDTPGLEDALGLQEAMLADASAGEDPVARIRRFVEGDHAGGRFEQEARVLRQMLDSDAALYVIDAREPVLAKHRAELRLLADCGRPVLPLLNFTDAPESAPENWRAQLAGSGLHLVVAFDTVAFDAAGERRVFETLGNLLGRHQARIRQLIAHRKQQAAEQRREACQHIARLLVDAAGMRREATAETVEATWQAMQQSLREAEADCVADLRQLFAFELAAYHPPDLPLEHGQWRTDLFDPETARQLGLRGGSGAAAGGAAGFGVDAMTGGLSLGAGTLIGAGIGAAMGVGNRLGVPWWQRLRGRHSLVVSPATLEVLAARQLLLLRALLQRGHAATRPIEARAFGSALSPRSRHELLRARAHPEWSRLNTDTTGKPAASTAVDRLAGLLTEEAMKNLSD